MIDVDQLNMIVMTYGDVPTQRAFHERYLLVVGRGNYQMELVGEDLEAMQAAYGDPRGWTKHGKGFYEFDWQNLYRVIQSLVEEGDQGGIEAPTNLASAILGTLGFEWV